MVDFCEKCGAIVIGKKGEKVECPACGAKQKTNFNFSLKEKIKKVEEKEVLDTTKTVEIHPRTPVECPQCNHNEAYYWTKQTRSGDEPETQFFKCVECAHQWRDYK